MRSVGFFSGERASEAWVTACVPEEALYCLMYEQTCLPLFCVKLMDMLVNAITADNTDPQGAHFPLLTFIFHSCRGLRGDWHLRIFVLHTCSISTLSKVFFLYVNQLSYHSQRRTENHLIQDKRLQSTDFTSLPKVLSMPACLSLQ